MSRKRGVVLDNYFAYTTINHKVLVWNRFSPSLLIFGEDDFDSLTKIIKGRKYEEELEPGFLSYLRENNLIPDIDYEAKYLSEMDKFLIEKETNMKATLDVKSPFHSIIFHNEECNLNCPYCIMKYTWNDPRVKKRDRPVDLDTINFNVRSILDQQYAAMAEHAKNWFSLTLNGGEPLVCNELITGIIDYIRKTRSDRESKISMNSNGTLITGEIAQFLTENDVELSISIDFNRKHHDSSRTYCSGGGSFDRVMAGLTNLKKCGYPPEKLFFQGTIDNFDLIDLNQISELADMGINRIRLSPNLMGISNDEGIRRAEKFFQLATQSGTGPVQVTDSIFRDFMRAIDKGVEYQYSPYCNGMGGHKSRSILLYNMTGNSVSYLCQFLPNAYVQFDSSKGIFNHEVLAKSIDFQAERIDKMKRYCLHCEIVGACRGGCLSSGLTAFNELNEAACSYMKSLWYLCVQEEFLKSEDMSNEKTQV